jgi:hypothetical protein
MQGIIAGGDVGPAVTAALALFGFGLLSVLVSLVVIRRTRRAQALGLTSVPTREIKAGPTPHVA